jgi:uncharacterized protein (DUF2147 family)
LKASCRSERSRRSPLKGPKRSVPQIGELICGVIIMKRTLGIARAFGAAGLLLIIQVALIASTAVEAGTSAPSAAGVWRQVDESGKVGALVTITRDGDVFVGRLSRLFLDPGDDPNPICENCPGDKHNQPFLGLVFIEGMKQSGLDYTGTVLDPETGKIYNAKMSLSPDGKRLTVRGYIGLSIFGRSQTWTRVE